MRNRTYREEDGHTYWWTSDGWMGAPTFLDGSVDEDSEGYVEDFDLSPEEMESLLLELNRPYVLFVQAIGGILSEKFGARVAFYSVKESHPYLRDLFGSGISFRTAARKFSRRMSL